MNKNTLKTIIDTYQHTFKVKLHTIESEWNAHYVCWAFEKKYNTLKIPSLLLELCCFTPINYNSHHLDPSSKKKIWQPFLEKLISCPYSIKGYLPLNAEIFKFFPEHFINSQKKILSLNFQSSVPLINTHTFETFDDFLNTKDRKRRYNFKRQLNIIDDSFKNSSLLKLNDSNSFEQFVKMHITEWNHKGHSSIFENKNTLDFFQKLYQKHIYSLYSLQSEKTTLSYHLGYENNTTFYYSIPTYNLSHTKYSPGISLLLFLTKKAIEEKKLMHLGGGIYPYKLWLCNDFIPIAKYSLYKSFSAHYKNHFVQTIKKTSKKYINKIFK